MPTQKNPPGKARFLALCWFLIFDVCAFSRWLDDEKDMIPDPKGEETNYIFCSRFVT
jgi:hypothetical protein